MGPMGPMGPMALPPMPVPNVSWPIYADFNSVPCFSDTSGPAGYAPNYMTDSKVAIVEMEEEPEPEDGGLEASQTSGVTANQTLDKTSEMMRSLAQKLETDKQLWSELEAPTGGLQLASDSTEPEKAMIEINTPRKAEKSHGLGSDKGLEILSMIQGNPKKVVRKAGSDAGDSCGRLTTESVLSSPEKTRRPRSNRSGQKRFCCNFILRFPPDRVPMVIGKGGQNTKDIYFQTGCKIRVRGRGSGHLEQGTSEEAPTPLMLAVTAEPNNKAGFIKAVELSLALLENLEERYCRETHEWYAYFKIVVDDEDLQLELEQQLGKSFAQRTSSRKETSKWFW
mmetsp:Transcript_54367/g.86504  ORF Transcript_54367/g.86504 Transcript_54367/m.86504 type:complete len:338 (-) Transcript_54367:31-1044(-)